DPARPRADPTLLRAGPALPRRRGREPPGAAGATRRCTGSAVTGLPAPVGLAPPRDRYGRRAARLDASRPDALPARRGAPRDHGLRGAPTRRDLERPGQAVAVRAALRHELRRARGAGVPRVRPPLAGRAGAVHPVCRLAPVARADDGAVAGRPSLALPGRAGLPPAGARAPTRHYTRALGRGDAAGADRRGVGLAARTGLGIKEFRP